MIDPYGYWRAALEITGGKRPLTRDEMLSLGVNENDVGCGFFKKKIDRDVYAPAAIWPSSNGLIGAVNGLSAEAELIWTYCCKHPIAEAAYRGWLAGNPESEQEVIL